MNPRTKPTGTLPLKSRIHGFIFTDRIPTTHAHGKDSVCPFRYKKTRIILNLDAIVYADLRVRLPFRKSSPLRITSPQYWTPITG